MAEYLLEVLAMPLEKWMLQQMTGGVAVDYRAELVQLLRQLVVSNASAIECMSERINANMLRKAVTI